MPKISNDLLEAYRGYYEDEVSSRFCHDGKLQEDVYEEWVTLKIKADTPKRRLEVYLEWNGIIGYSGRIYEIATGEL